MMGAVLLIAALAATPALAQSRARGSTDVAPGTRAETVAPVFDGKVAQGKGALLRGLDKMSGQSTDLPVNIGDTIAFGRLSVRLGECRFPQDDPESDAFAQLTITDTSTGKALFTGWMIASSPAISALDDARYDVWPVACNDGTAVTRPDLTYEPDNAVPEGGEGAGPDGEGAPPVQGTGGEGEGEPGGVPAGDAAPTDNPAGEATPPG